jgi:ribosome-associated toxin RatA of RatAB toxin-antitoxin module
MPYYQFITSWKLDAPLEKIWELISNVPEWQHWWPGVLEVKVLESAGNNGHQVRFAHTWRSFIPYKLKFVTEVTEIALYDEIKANVTGELKGTGRWKFMKDRNDGTIVTYFWFVNTTRIWMNLTAPFLSGIFRWNHDTVMRWGGMGLAKKLNCSVEFSSTRLH